MSAQMAIVFPELLAPEAPQIKNTTRPANPFGDLFGESTWAHISSAFEQMGIAEEEIAAYCKRYPDRRDEINGAFIHLRWIISTIAPEPVFRHHVRELLQRVVDKQSLKLGTTAEALMAFHITSLKAPLTNDGMVVATKLFRDVYGVVEGISDHQAQETWPGATEEMLSGLFRKLSCDRDCTN